MCVTVQGNTMACQGQYVAAIEYFTKAIQLDSSDYRSVSVIVVLSEHDFQLFYLSLSLSLSLFFRLWITRHGGRRSRLIRQHWHVVSGSDGRGRVWSAGRQRSRARVAVLQARQTRWQNARTTHTGVSFST